MIFLSGWRVRSVLFAIQTVQQSQACSKEYKISTLQYSMLLAPQWLIQLEAQTMLSSIFSCLQSLLHPQCYPFVGLQMLFGSFASLFNFTDPSVLPLMPFLFSQGILFNFKLGLCLWLTLGGRDEIPRRVPASKAKLFQFLLLNLKLCFCVSLYLNICLTWHSPLGEPLSMAIMYQGQPALMR